PAALGAQLQDAAQQVAGLVLEVIEVGEPAERRGLGQDVLDPLGQRGPAEGAVEVVRDPGAELGQVRHGATPVRSRPYQISDPTPGDEPVRGRRGTASVTAPTPVR